MSDVTLCRASIVEQERMVRKGQSIVQMSFVQKSEAVWQLMLDEQEQGLSRRIVL